MTVQSIRILQYLLQMQRGKVRSIDHIRLWRRPVWRRMQSKTWERPTTRSKVFQLLHVCVNDAIAVQYMHNCTCSVLFSCPELSLQLQPPTQHMSAPSEFQTALAVSPEDAKRLVEVTTPAKELTISSQPTSNRRCHNRFCNFSLPVFLIIGSEFCERFSFYGCGVHLDMLNNMFWSSVLYPLSE